MGLHHRETTTERFEYSEVFGPYVDLLEVWKDTTLHQARVEEKSFGNIFMAGTRTYINETMDITLEDILTSPNNSSYYASFATFLTSSAVERALGRLPPSFAVDTNDWLLGIE